MRHNKWAAWQDLGGEARAKDLFPTSFGYFWVITRESHETIVRHLLHGTYATPIAVHTMCIQGLQVLPRPTCNIKDSLDRQKPMLYQDWHLDIAILTVQNP